MLGFIICDLMMVPPELLGAGSNLYLPGGRLVSRKISSQIFPIIATIMAMNGKGVCDGIYKQCGRDKGQ